MNKSLPTIYSDMDGVLADFDRAARVALGHSHHATDIDNSEYEKIGKLKNFWENIPPMRDFDIYWNFIKKYNPHILTAYPSTWDDPHAVHGKKLWNRKYLRVPEGRMHIVSRKSKKIYAIDKETGKPNLLIDDYEKNINEWTAAGGIAIHHTNAFSTIIQLKNLGFK